ncbi:MAG: site-2 protease family protein [Candidatus Nanopelagicales bacterium]
MDPEEPRQRGLFRLGGIPVSVPWSGVIGVLLIAWLWSPQFALAGGSTTEQVVLSGAFAVLLYLSILVHELAHAWSARAFGFQVTGIVLWVLGGFTLYERQRQPSPGREAAVAASGPIATALIAVVTGVVAATVAGGWDPRVVVLLEALAWGNAVMAVYNALPGLPLDGGAVLKAVVWGATRSEYRGTVVAAWSGRVLAVVLVAAPLALFWGSGASAGIGLLLAGAIFAAILWTGATQALRRARVEELLPSLTAQALARRAVPVDKDLPLSEALRRLGGAGAGGLVVVDHDGQPLGIAHEAAVSATPLQRRPWVPVGSVSRRIDPRAVLAQDLVGDALLRAMQDHPAPEYLVVDGDGRVVGVLAAQDVEAALSA